MRFVPLARPPSSVGVRPPSSVGVRPPSSFGLTLLELILAMAMTSILAFSLYASLQTAFKARDGANASIEPMRAVHVALDLIGQDIESALLPTGVLAGAFVGMPTAEGGILVDSLELYSVEPGAARRLGASALVDPTLAGGIRKVEFLVATLEGDSRPALIRRVTRNLLSPRAVFPEDEILCRGVASFTLRYYDGTAWSETWDSTTLEDTLPLLVEATLALEQPAQGSLEGAVERSLRVYSLACWQDPATKKGGS